jgi:hypothetical protein
MKKTLLFALAAMFALSLAFGAETKSSSSKSSGSKSSSSKSSGSKTASPKGSSAAPSMAGKLGLGILIGAPMGVSGKYYFSKTLALDVAAGYATSEDAFRLHSDVLFHNDKLLTKAFEGFPMALYYGAGAKFVFTDKFMFGVRLPVGVLHNFKKCPVDMYFEVVPVVLLAPDVKLDLDAALGARYYFGLK